MDKDKDYLANYRVNENKVNEATQHQQKIKGLETKGEELSGKINDNEKELKELQDGDLETPEDRKRFEDLTQENKSLHSEIDQNKSDLFTAKQEYEQFKEANSGLSQEADSTTVDSTYKEETGRELDQNVGGYDTFQQEGVSKPLDEQSKDQAREAVSGMMPDQEVSQQNQQDNTQEPLEAKEGPLSDYPAQEEGPGTGGHEQEIDQDSIDRWEDDGGR